MILTRTVRMLVATALVGAVSVLCFVQPASAACAADLPTDKGRDTLPVQVSKEGTYRVWLRMYSTGAAADAILLRVDDTYCAITVGNSGTLKANGFTWVNFQDGDVANFIDVRLTAGNHAITMAGVEAGVGVDRLLFLTDKNCVPEGTGDNCGDETDVIALPFSGLANNGTVQQVEEAIPKHKVNVGGMIAAGAVALTLVALGVGWYGWRHNWQWPRLRKGGK